MAPVENQLQTKTNGRFQTFDGTSAAQPQVCGAVANVMALLPGLTEAEASKLIKETALPSLNSQEKPQRNGAGTLNAYKMAAVATRLKAEWPHNRSRLFSKDPNIYEFPESQKLFDEAKELLNLNNPKTASNPCATRDGLIMLRKAALLSPHNISIREELAKTYRKLGYTRNARFYESMKGITLKDLEKLWKEFSTTKHEAMSIAREAEKRGREALPLLEQILKESTAADVIKIAANSVQKIAPGETIKKMLIAAIPSQKSLAPALKSLQLAKELGTPQAQLDKAIKTSMFKQQLSKAAQGE